MTTSPPQELSSREIFDADLHWFMSHVQSLAMSPAECCADQGHHLVAGELFHFLLQPMPSLDGSYGLLTAEQIRAIASIRASVQAVPPAARSGPPGAAGSLKDMQHPSWCTPRQLAGEVLEIVGPLWRERIALEAR